MMIYDDLPMTTWCFPHFCCSGSLICGNMGMKKMGLQPSNCWAAGGGYLYQQNWELMGKTIGNVLLGI